MDKLKMHIQQVMLAIRNNKNAIEKLKEIAVFMAKVSLLTANFKSGFQSFVLTEYH